MNFSADSKEPGRRRGDAGSERDRSATASFDWPSYRDAPADTDHTWERLLHRMIELGPQPFAAINLEERIVHVNRAFTEMVGYARDELLGMSIMDLTAPQSRAATIHSHAVIKETGKPLRVQKQYRRKDGSLVPVELIIDLAHDDDGRTIGMYAFITDITTRLQAEEALRLSEQRYRQLYDEAPVGYHELDRKARLINVNQTACAVLGYPREKLLGRSVFEFVAPEERDEAQVEFQKGLAEDRPPAPFTQVLITSDGRRLVMEIHESRHRDESGRIVGLRRILKDVTDQRQAEAARIESERRTRALFDSIHDAVFVHDTEGKILDANPAACHLLGYSREELLGMSTREVDAPEFAEGFEDRLERQLAGACFRCEGLHRTKNGQIIPVEITTSTMQYGNRPAVLAIIRDITERKALERTRRELIEAQIRNAEAMEAKNRALSESEARYRQLAEGSLDAIVAADAEGRITLFNPAAEKIFGRGSEEVLGQPLEQIIPGIFESVEEDPSGPAPAEHAPRISPIVGKTVELTGLRRDGNEFPLELSLSSVEANGQIQYIGSIRDQTERQRMRAMLTQSDKLASIGLLSAGVAHEINNPLAYVGNNLAVLQREVKGLFELLTLYESSRGLIAPASPEVIEQIDALAEEIDLPYIRENLVQLIARTLEGVKRVANIVQNLRGLARTSPPQWESVSLPDLVENALEVMRGRLKHQRIEVVVQTRDVPRIECVPSQISQVLLNLLINALQAVEAAGREDGGRIEVEARREGPWVVISISDNGVGIDPDHRERLFDPFFTTKPVGEGTGLGLAISHGIVTGHGGRIEVQSRPGEGSRFRILLPGRHQPSAPTP